MGGVSELTFRASEKSADGIQSLYIAGEKGILGGHDVGKSVSAGREDNLEMD
jgi:hypothetical protein